MGTDINLFTPHANMHVARLTCKRRACDGDGEEVRRFVGEKRAADWMGTRLQRSHSHYSNLHTHTHVDGR